MAVQGLFPTPVGLYEIDELTEEQHRWIVSRPAQKNTKNRISSDKYLLDADIMTPVRAQIETYLAQYFRETLSDSNSLSLRITQSWCNYAGVGESHPRHSHRNSIVSGVYYPQTTPEDTITFHHPTAEYRMFDLSRSNFNAFNSGSWWLPTPQNTLILFPSDLQHSVSARNRTDIPDRVSLSFNTFFIGELGNDGAVTALSL